MLEREILLAEMDAEKVSREIGDFVVKTVLEQKSTGCVVGLSGGVDSTTVAALIKKAFDGYNASNENKLELVGYILPSSVNLPKDTEDGVKVAERLGIRYELQPIDKIVKAYGSTNPEATGKHYHKGNLMSRIRSNVLSTKAATERKIVAGTGNKDEDFGLGYYTLFGDGAVHISPIGNLPKRLVRQMASYLGFDDLANREPTAGLEPGQTDFKDLGYSYDLAELVIGGLYQLNNSWAMEFASEKDLAAHSQIAPLIKKEMNQYKSMYGSAKFISAVDLVRDIFRRHEIALFKAKIIHPPAAHVALEYRWGE